MDSASGKGHVTNGTRLTADRADGPARACARTSAGSPPRPAAVSGSARPPGESLPRSAARAAVAGTWRVSPAVVQWSRVRRVGSRTRVARGKTHAQRYLVVKAGTWPELVAGRR